MPQPLSLATGALVATALALSSAALAEISIVQTTAAAPTYTTQLTFDEPGAPTGQLPPNTWVPDYGLTIEGGAGNPFVGDLSGIFGPWAGTGNAITANFGLFLTFDTALTEMSFQAWDDSGPPTPFGGGLAVALFNDGQKVGFQFFTPAFGGVGKTWFNITTSGASVFDEVRVLGFASIGSNTIMDNLSWNAVPTPGGIAVLLMGLAGRSRRRS